MPEAVVHAPRMGLSGLNIPNLYTEQLVTQILMLLQYSSQLAEMMGILIWALAEAMKLESRLAGEVWATPLTFKALITDTWLKWLWLDLLKYGIMIQTDLLDFTPQWVNDIELMRLFAQNGYRGQDQATLNCCHMVLQVIWLSKICMGSGHEVLQEAWNGNLPLQLLYNWPQTAPGKNSNWLF